MRLQSFEGDDEVRLRAWQPEGKWQKRSRYFWWAFIAFTIAWMCWHLAAGHDFHKDEQFRQMRNCLQAGNKYATCHEVFIK